MSILAAIIAILYGVLTAFAGFSQIKTREIQTWSAAGMILSGLLVAVSGGLLLNKMMVFIYLLVVGLVAIHLLTINNGLKMHGKINPRHHIVRLIISLTILVLAILGMPS